MTDTKCDHVYGKLKSDQILESQVTSFGKSSVNVMLSTVTGEYFQTFNFCPKCGTRLEWSTKA